MAIPVSLCKTRSVYHNARYQTVTQDSLNTFFKKQSEPSKWMSLKPDELRQLEAYYVLCAPSSPQRRILCKSGFRLNDLKTSAKRNWMANG